MPTNKPIYPFLLTLPLPLLTFFYLYSTTLLLSIIYLHIPSLSSYPILPPYHIPVPNHNYIVDSLHLAPYLPIIALTFLIL